MRTHALLHAFRITAALVLLLLLPACADQDDDPPTGPGGAIDADFVRNLMVSEFASIRNALGLPGGPPGCCSLSPVPLADSDGDGVPDVCTFTYDEQGCAWQEDGYAFTTWGTIVVSDPGAAFGYHADIVELNVRETSGDPSRTITRTQSGSRTVSGAPTEVTLETALDVVLSSAGADTARVQATWTAVFTADPGASISFGLGHPYPAGQAVITGQLAWTQGGTTFEFDVVTVRALRNDPACMSPFAVDGEVWVVLTGAGSMNGHLQMTCSGCGGQIEFEWVQAR